MFKTQFFQIALNASQVRGDNLLSGFSNIPDPAQYGKHRSCYAVYTNLKKIHEGDTFKAVQRASSRDALFSSKSSILARDECLLCRKNKTQKGGSGYEVLQKCVTFASAEGLLAYSKTNNDEYAASVLAGLSEGEVIANEFKFHRTCYRDTMRTPSALVEDNVKQNEKDMRNKYFEDVKSIIQSQVIDSGDSIKLSSLAELYGQFQAEMGLEKIGAVNRNLKARLANSFGDKITFFQKANGLPEFIYNTEKLKNVRIYDPVEVVKEAARIVRKELMESPDIYSEWPPTEKELLSKTFETTPFTRTLLSSIISKHAKNTDRNSRLVDSIAQDLVYNASNGRKRVPKHVQLGLSIKRKTGSVSVIRWLNRFGHCISYDEINATETKIAEGQVINQTTRTYVPNNIQPGTLVTFVYDNCDHNAESIYNVTLHGTNGIVIQLKSVAQNVVTENVLPVSNTLPLKKRRSFKPVIQELQPFMKPKQRTNPLPLVHVDKDVNHIDGWISKCEDITWSILRYTNHTNQVIPAWKGFFF